MKHLPLILSLLFISNFTFAQNTELTRCSTTEYMERQMEEHPGYMERRQQIEEFTRNYISENASSRKAGEIIYIPTVVHVVYKNAAENISDAQVLSQIRVLNEDFRKMFGTNGWNTNPVGVDSKIEFVMAQRDPNGDPTNGITRTSTIVPAFTVTDDVKYSSKGGKDAWDTKKYLNFWTCDLGGPILGYAQFPGGSPETDGVVIGYKYYGVGHSGAGQYNLGRTATHEVGHWLNLRHIWGDGNCASDLVDDTPPSKGENTGCPKGETSNCNGKTTQDMIENYMDYTDDICMNIITKGQADRMKAALDGPRAGIKDSDGLDTIPNALDAELVEIISPTATSCSPDSITPKVKVKNLGVNQINSLVLTHTFTPGDSVSFEWIGEIAPNESVTINLPKVLLPVGVNSFKVIVSKPNKGADGNSANDKKSVNARVIAEPVADFTADKERVVLQSGDSLVSFSNISIGATYNWDFENGLTSKEKNPVVKFDTEGIYNVSLTVTAPGCTKPDTKKMEIKVVESTVGVKHQEMKLVRIYPNPVSSTLSVNVNSTDIIFFSLTDITGKVIMNDVFSEKTNGLDLSSLETGFYFLKVSNGISSNTLKIVKK